jgi:hypothetical protein
VPKIKENQKLESISNSKTIIFVAQEKKTAFTYMVYVITIPEHRKTWDGLVQAMENQFL